MSPVMRVQTGLGLFDDGWRVVQQWTHPDGTIEPRVYDPPFATEREAEAKAAEAAKAWRDLIAEMS